MSHIDEGLIHARLDGALEGEDRILWTEAAAHLDLCGDCRRRFEEARRLRADASTILSGADAASGTRPAFAEIAAEAARRRGGSDAPEAEQRAARPAARPAAPWWRSTQRLAWAASLVLALGAGWIGRSLVETDRDQPTVAEMSTPAPDAEAEASSAARERSDAETADADAAPPAEVRELDRGEPERLTREPPAAPVGADVSGDGGVDRDEAQEFRAAIPRQEQAAREAEALEDAAAPAQANAPAGDRASNPTCYSAVSDLAKSEAEVAGDAVGAVEEAAPGADRAGGALAGFATLRLNADGTATATTAAGRLVGFWSESDPGTVALRLGDGATWTGLRLERREAELIGGAAEGVDIRLAAGACRTP